MLSALLAGWLSVAGAQEEGVTVGPAHAPEAVVGFGPLPSAKDVKKLDVAAYNDLLIDDDYQLLLHMVREFRIADQAADIDGRAAFLMQMSATMHTAAERTKKIPPFGKDGSLRDGVAAAYTEWATLFDAELAALDQLSATVKSDADAARFEAVRLPLDARWVAAEDAPARAQAAFAKRHRLVLVDGEVEPTLQAVIDYPPFEAAGLPPEGSKLPAEDWTGLAIGYHNALLDLQNALVDAGNAMATETEDSQLEATRTVQLEKTRKLRAEVDRFGPLVGDDAWAKAVQEYAAWQEGQLAVEWATYAKTVAERKSLGKKDADQLNAIADANFAGTRSRLEALAGHRDAMVGRFAFREYDAWAARRGELLGRVE